MHERYEPSSDHEVTTVLFDLDETICEYRRPTAEVLDLAFSEAGVDPFFSATDWHTAMPRVTGVTDHDEFRRACFELVAEDAGHDVELARAVAAAYGAERDHTDVRFVPGAEEALASLAESHRLGLVTNGAREVQEQKLAALGLVDTFEHAVYAGSDTAPKPETEPFERALAGLGVTPAETVHVGNSLAADVAGARAAGVGSVWLPPEPGADPGTHAPDHTLDTLADVGSIAGLAR